jgi:hypothetical protein
MNNLGIKEIELKDIPENPVALSSKEAHSVLKECFIWERLTTKFHIRYCS